MKRIFLSLIVLLCNLGLVFSQTHFSTVWEGENGNEHMNFYVTSASLNGINIQIGDEIAVFDAEYCVGVGVYSGSYNVRVKASKDDDDAGVNGFRPGNPYTFKLWDASEGAEVTSVSVNLQSGSSTFSASTSAYMGLTFTVSCSPISAPTVSLTQPVCGGTTGSIEITSPTGTGMTYSIDGSTYSGSMIYSNIAAGTYSVTAKNSIGCMSNATSATINAKPIPAVPAVTVSDQCGSSTLSTTAGGTLLWSNGATTSSITVNNAGTYTVTQTVNGCTSASGSGTAAPKSTPAVPSVTVVDNCGSSTLSTAASGTLHWNTGAVTPDIIVTSAGTYSVTQTVNGCTSASGSGIAAPKAVPSTPGVTVANNCNGTSTLSTTAAGTLLWSTGAVTSSIIVTEAATYTVNQTVNGCTSASGSGIAAPKTAPATPAVTVTDNCGSSTLSTTATGTLLWSTGAVAQSINVTSAGTYSVTQTVNGCTSAAGSGTAAPKAIPATPVVTVVNDCGSSTLSTTAAGTLVWSTGAATPSITVTTAGTRTVTQTVNGCTSASGSGTAAPKTTPAAPVVSVVNNCDGTSTLSTTPAGTLLWSTGAVTSSIIVTEAATYTVTQTVNGCTSASGSGTAAPKTTPATPAVTVSDNCGSSTLSTTASGTLLWSTGAVTPSIAVTNAGTYTVTQTVNGCTSASGSGIAAPKAVPATPAVNVVNNCNGTSTLSTTASGTLLWSTGASTSSIIVTNAGTHTVTQTVNGCTSLSGSGTAAPKSTPAAPAVTVSDNCGSSTLSTSTAGTLLWSTGAVTPSITVTNAGTYTVTQTVNGCTSASGSGIAAPKTAPATPVVNVVNNCNGTSNLSTTAAGTLLWSTGAATPNITVTNAGTYTVTQTANGCTSASGSGTAAPKTTPAAPVITVVNNCNGTSTLSTTTAGTLLWSTGDATPSITVTEAGAYTVTQTVNGCTSASGSGNAAPKTTPATPAVTVSDNCGSSTLSTTASGTLLWSTGAATPSITVTNAGTYTVTQTVNGCTSASGSKTAAPKAIPGIPALGTITQPGCNTPTGSIILNGLPSGNWTIIPGSITGSASSTTVSGLATGTYNFTVTNALGCTSPATANVVINAQPSIPATPITGTVTQPTCSVATGSVALSGLPSSGTWTITRTPGGNTNSGTGTSYTVNGIAAGTYTFKVTNASGCTSSASSSVTITSSPNSPAAPTVSAINQPGCSIATGSATLNGLPSSGTWTLTRTPGGTTYTGTGTSYTINGGIPAGATYTFAVTNASGCTSASSADVIINAQPETPAAPGVISITQPTCIVVTGSVMLNNLPSSGTWTLTRVPGNVNYTGTGTSYTATGIAAGNYNFTVSGSSGCTSPASAGVTINEIPDLPPAPVVGNITQPTCLVTTGSAALSGLPSSGTWTVTQSPGGITYSNTGTNYTVSGIPAGTYTFTVTNALGCVSSASATVEIVASSDAPSAPVVGSITNPSTSQETGSIALSGLPVSGTWTLTTYPGATTTTGSGTGIVVTGLESGSYHFTVTNSSGCVSPASADGDINAVPQIESQVALVMPEDDTLVITLANFIFDDADSDVADFTLIIGEGSNYTARADSIIPSSDYHGSLTVPITVNDGIATSDVFNMVITVTPVNDTPIISNIPDQTIEKGESFAEIDLDLYVEDIETEDAQIAWSYTGCNNISALITDCKLNVSVLDQNWTGSDTIVIKAVDNDATNPITVTDTVVFTVNYTTGIVDDDPMKAMAYPNPTGSIVHIVVNLPETTEIEMEVLSAQGKMITNTKKAVTDSRVDVNLGNIPSGLYIIRMKAGDAVSLVKIAKQ